MLVLYFGKKVHVGQATWTHAKLKCVFTEKICSKFFTKMRISRFFPKLVAVCILYAKIFFCSHIMEASIFQMTNMVAENASELTSMTSRSKMRCLQECSIKEECASVKYNPNNRQCTLFSSLEVTDIQPEDIAYIIPSHLVITTIGRYY